MGGVLVAHGLGEGDEGGSVVDGVDVTEEARSQGEDVADEDVDVVSGVMKEVAGGGDDRGLAEVGKELVDGELAEFGTGDLSALREEPVDVDGSATERDEDSAAGGELEFGEVFDEKGVGGAFVESGFFALPAFLPEFGLHGDRFKRELDRGGL